MAAQDQPCTAVVMAAESYSSPILAKSSSTKGTSCIHGVSNRYQASFSHLGTRLTYYMLGPNQNSYWFVTTYSVAICVVLARNFCIHMHACTCTLTTCDDYDCSKAFQIWKHSYTKGCYLHTLQWLFQIFYTNLSQVTVPSKMCLQLRKDALRNHLIISCCILGGCHKTSI